MKKQPEANKPPPEPEATEETPFEKFERVAKKVIRIASKKPVVGD